MKRALVILSFCLAPLAANAADYKCYASKFPEDLQHAFQDGYVLLSVNKTSVKFEYYRINTVAKETTVEYSATYKLNGLKGGKSRLKDLIVGDVEIGPKHGDSIDPIYFEPSLIENTDFSKKGIIGKFVFAGHGFSYDWNVCYNVK